MPKFKINKAEELFNKVKPHFDKLDIEKYAEDINQMPERGQRDVKDKENWGYYQFLISLIEVTKPLQVVELGGAMGVACVCMSAAQHKPQIYSITLEEHGLEFSYIKKNYPNLHKIVGDDLDMSNWEGVDLKKTDIWFIDTEHLELQLRKELELYTPYFKKGAILLFDDIHMDELWPVWLDLPYDKFDATRWLHFSGYGICIV